jgi:hypothetical protein
MKEKEMEELIINPKSSMLAFAMRKKITELLKSYFLARTRISARNRKAFVFEDFASFDSKFYLA